MTSKGGRGLGGRGGGDLRGGPGGGGGPPSDFSDPSTHVALRKHWGSTKRCDLHGYRRRRSPTFLRVKPRLATSVCQLRHDQMEQGPTEPQAGRSTFLLSLVVRGADINEWLLIRGPLSLRTSFPAGR